MEISRSASADTTTWTLTIAGGDVAWLSVWTVNGEICEVETLSAHQGNGYARALFDHADAERGIFHTIPTHRTEEGDAFASRVGGDTIADADALVIDVCCCDHCDA